MTLQKQTSLFTEEKSTYLQVDSLANPTQQQESDLAKRMRDTSGRRCLEQYGRFNRHGSWAKTFSDLLIGTGGWFSTRCRLTWKLKGTKYNRMYFQLYPSTLPTDGTEYGLLPTPKTMDCSETINSGKTLELNNGVFTNIRKKDGMRFGPSLNDIAKVGLLPTPQAMDSMTNPRRDITPSGRIISNQGHNGSAPLKDLAMNGMLPTPRVKGHGNSHQRIEDGKIDDLTTMARFNMLPTPMASDCGEKVTGLENQDSLVKMAREATGQTSQLNPQFVLEMMGFPPNWTLLPFLGGETNQSKPEVML
jgi:hypothetical protein